jgi:hypothetical protein
MYEVKDIPVPNGSTIPNYKLSTTPTWSISYTLTYGKQVKFNQTKLNCQEDNPYLFVGELSKKVFDYTTWLGGTSDFALQ